MNIPKAIEILSAMEEIATTSLEYDDRDALKIGIKALERFQEQRQDPHCRGFWKLPGETED